MLSRPSHQMEPRKLSQFLMFAISGLIIFVLSFTTFAFWMGGDDSISTFHSYPIRNPILVNALSHTNCSDFDGAIRMVKDLAKGRGYLHTFEYERLHPCCMAKQDNQLGTLDDILFIVMTSSETKMKAQAIKNSWGAGLGKHLMLVSDVDDTTLGSITFDEVNGKKSEVNPLDSQHRSVVGLKHIYSDSALRHYKNKKWFFLVDDDTWINVPATLNLISKYSSSCPLLMSYVWSGVWIEDLDYASGSAGFLLSQAAFEEVAPAFFGTNSECAYAHYSEIAFSKCAWHRQVQLIHHQGFYFDRPDMSKDRHEHVWYPPIGEAISYHDVDSKEMKLMSQYVNERWNIMQDIKEKNTTNTTTKVKPI